MKSETKPSFFKRLHDRLFPKMPDFYAMLAEQSTRVAGTAGLLVEFMETGDPGMSARIIEDERSQDSLKIKNLQLLNEAFATPMDREDIYRAIADLDEVVNYCKATVNEMDVLGVTPDKFTLELAMHVREGADALKAGFAGLAATPSGAAADAERARKAERAAEKAYRRAIAALFQGDAYINMFKRREIYRHLSNAADRIAAAAFTLHDIVVKAA
ncbi:MAG: DUF47 family protein [Verrucomicrobiaceae bacterium]|nr:DUF47 family protein [Verrucomicrobiaceae bacterium]